MGPVLVRVVVVAFAVASASVPGSAQGQRQLEFTVLGGTAHTDRSARLITEESVEPFAGVRVGARLRSLWGGQAGVVVQWDRYGDSRSVRVGPPCLGICAADARIPVPDSLVDLHMSKSDERFMVGGSWSRPIISWLRADVLGLVGMRRADSSTEYAGLTNGRAAIRRGGFRPDTQGSPAIASAEDRQSPPQEQALAGSAPDWPRRAVRPWSGRPRPPHKPAPAGSTRSAPGTKPSCANSRKAGSSSPVTPALHNKFSLTWLQSQLNILTRFDGYRWPSGGPDDQPLLAQGHDPRRFRRRPARRLHARLRQ